MSNTVIIIIVIVIITLLGSHWLLGVSVLELKLSDWFMSPDHWCFNKSGFFWELFFFFFSVFLITAACFRGPRGSLVTDGRDFFQSEFYMRSETRPDHGLHVCPLSFCPHHFAALRVSLRCSSKTLKPGFDLVRRVQRDKSVYALYIIWWMVMAMLRININSNLMNEWINEWVN